MSLQAPRTRATTNAEQNPKRMSFSTTAGPRAILIAGRMPNALVVIHGMPTELRMAFKCLHRVGLGSLKRIAHKILATFVHRVCRYGAGGISGLAHRKAPQLGNVTSARFGRTGKGLGRTDY